MNDIQIFNSEEFGQIRTIEIDGKPYFVANDVAKALGYSNPSKATNDHCKHAIYGRGNDSLGRENNFKYIPENDIYRLVIGSQLPSAERFESWVFDEVLPSIRRTGGYQIPQTYVEALRALADKTEEAERMATEMIAMNDKIEEMLPKVSYLDRILESEEKIVVTQVAQDYGMSARAFNKLLLDLGIQHKVHDQWILYSRYQGNGYTDSTTAQYDKHDGRKGTKKYTVWTQKGLFFLYEHLKGHGILPVIER